MPAFPAFVIAVCSVPLLVPRLGERLAGVRAMPPPRQLARGGHWVAAGAVALAVLPLVVVAALPVQKEPVLASYVLERVQVPVVDGLAPATGTRPGTVYLQWPAVKTPSAGSPFYVVFRSPKSVPGGLICDRDGAARCVLGMQRIGNTTGPAYSDISPPVPAGDWTYRIGVAANAQRDSGGSGLMLLSPPVDVTVPGR
jgi:hypothetical protein